MLVSGSGETYDVGRLRPRISHTERHSLGSGEQPTLQRLGQRTKTGHISTLSVRASRGL